MPRSVTQPDDLFTFRFDSTADYPANRFDRQLVLQALKGPLPGVEDLDLCDAMVHLARSELSSFGCGGRSRLSDEEMRLLLRTCKVVCARIGIEFPSLPFWGLEGFRSYWKSEGMAGSYAARRGYIDRVFQPVADAIMRRSVVSWEDVLIQPISPRSATGWALLDGEILQLRQRFAIARTEQDYCAVGAACVRILEHLGEVAFDPAIHLPPMHRCRAASGPRSVLTRSSRTLSPGRITPRCGS